MKAQPLIISLTVLLTTLVLATSHALDAKARDDQLGHPSPLTVVKGGLIIDGTGAPAFEGEVWIQGRDISRVIRGGTSLQGLLTRTAMVIRWLPRLLKTFWHKA